MGFFISVGSYQAHIPSWKIILLGIAPHGILELPAFVWAAAIGIANGFAVIRWIQVVLQRNPKQAVTVAERREVSPITSALNRTLRSMPYIACLLLFAAII